MDVGGSHLIPLHRRGSGFVLRVDYARWGGTAEDLRHVALSAPHARTRERALALFDITQHSCATQVAMRTGRRAHTVMDWVHAYNQGGPDALVFRRTRRRPPCFARCWDCRSGRPCPVPHSRRAQSLFCPQREAELGEPVCPPQRAPPPPPIEGPAPMPRCNLRRLVGWV